MVRDERLKPNHVTSLCPVTHQSMRMSSMSSVLNSLPWYSENVTVEKDTGPSNRADKNETGKGDKDVRRLIGMR